MIDRRREVKNPPIRVREFVTKPGRPPSRLRRVLNWYMLPPKDYARLKIAMDLIEYLPALIKRLEHLEQRDRDSTHEERLRKIEDWKEYHAQERK